jgi:hypothetical protein
MNKSLSIIRVHEISARTLAKYPKDSIWVDIWHLAFPTPNGKFEINIRQSTSHFKNYYESRVGIKKFGYQECYSTDELVRRCKAMIDILGIQLENFEVHGSTIFDSAWLQARLKPEIVAPKEISKSSNDRSE